MLELVLSIGTRASIDKLFLFVYNGNMKVNPHAKALSELGASKGGKARAEALTKDQRSQIARNAVIARWSKEKGLPIQLIAQPKGNKIIRATHEAPLKIGDSVIDSAVLEGGVRVLARISVLRAIGRTGKAKGGRSYDKESKIPVFLTANNLKPFVSEAILRNSTPIPFKTLKGTEAIGYKAEILPEICNVFIDAKEANKLLPNQEHIYQQCKRLIRGFATVGIIALIDEATGYQKQKDDYQKILEQYIAPELRPWVKTFDDEYYKQLYRLLGWDWDAFKKTGKTHSQYIGKLTNRIVYEKLAPGILEALKALNPKNKKGYREHRYHQELSNNVGYIKLIKHLSAVTTMMEQFGDGQMISALHKIDSRYPSLKIGSQLSLDFPISGEQKQPEAK